MNYHSAEGIYANLKVLQKVWANSAFSDLTPSKSVLNCFGSRTDAQCNSQTVSDTDLKHQMTWNSISYLWKNSSFPCHVPKKRFQRCSARAVLHLFPIDMRFSGLLSANFTYDFTMISIFYWITTSPSSILENETKWNVPWNGSHSE